MTQEQQLKLRNILNNKFKVARLIEKTLISEFLPNIYRFRTVSKYNYQTEEDLLKQIVDDVNLYAEKFSWGLPNPITINNLRDSKGMWYIILSNEEYETKVHKLIVP